MAVGPSAKIAVPEGARVVEAAGAFLLPGLWDMHVHLASYPEGLPLFVAYGVTGVRDMGSASARETGEMLAWSREISAGVRVGPRLVVAGPTLDGLRAFESDGRIFVSDAASAPTAVATVRERGGAFVKVHDWVGREAYGAIAESARAAGLPLVGHTPAAIPALDAIAAGQHSIEHLGSSFGGFLLDASSREAALRAEILARMDAARRAGSERAFWEWALGDAHRQELLDSWDAERASALVTRLAASGTWHCPTLTVLSPSGRGRSEEERLGLFASARSACGGANLTPPSPPSPSSLPSEAARALFARQLEVVAALQRGGVGLLTGTDTMIPSAEAIEEFGTCDVPLAGLSVHEELEWLVEAGLRPEEALRAATDGPARFFGGEEGTGGVAPGRPADLVLLDANPLEEIRNTRKIRAVVAAGRLFERPALDALIRDARAVAATR